MTPKLLPNAEMRRLRGHEWQSTGADPQLAISRRFGGARYALVELVAQDRPLDIAVYTRLRGVFSEEERIDFPERRRLLLIIDLAEGCARQGVRLDPTETEDSNFTLRVWSRRGRRGLARLVKSRLAQMPGLEVAILGPDPGLRGTAPRMRLPRLAKRSFEAALKDIWDLAAVDAALAPPVEAPPSVSFLVPVYNAEPAWLSDLLASFLAQVPGGELVLSDDGSTRADTALWIATHARIPGVTVVGGAQNSGIAAATNRALEAATGTWVALLDHDDALAPHALDRVQRAIGAHPDALFFFTDEVIADAQLRPQSAFWKPAFDPVLLSGVNYVNHLSVYNRARLVRLGGLRKGYDGSQDYELVLRYTRGLAAEEVVHIPYPAYIWRQRSESVSHAGRDRATTRARAALSEHFGRTAGAAEVSPALLKDLHRVRFPVAAKPAVSIVIPNRDSFELMERLLADLFERTDYPDFDVVVVDNGSSDPRVPRLYERYAATGRLVYEIKPASFNFAAMVNRGASLARGDAVLLLNNDISVLDPDWLGEMVACLAFPGTAIVGARLLFPDKSLQHAGVGLGLGGYAGHWYYKADPCDPGPMGRLQVRNGLTAVTAACMLVTRSAWDRLGGMDDVAFAVAYNDVDFCARARELGLGVVWTPFATLLHHESLSRGSDMIGEKAARFRAEKSALERRHGTSGFIDPALSPWYSRYQSVPRLVVGDRLPAPRSFMGFPGPAAEAVLPLREEASAARPSVNSPYGDRPPMPRSAQASPTRPATRPRRLA